jgi:spore maturation protein CgeB
MGENDVVRLMAQDLKSLCDLTLVDLKNYSNKKNEWVHKDESFSSNRPIYWLDEKKTLQIIEKNTNFVVVNSGGVSLKPSTIKLLKKKGIVCVGISLSDPDVFPENGKIYSQYYDLFYTNSLYAFKNLYSKKNNIGLLPFAASTSFHRPLDQEKTFDVVVVGHTRPERLKVVNKLKRHFNVGLFGRGWGKGSKIVNGKEHVKAINSGKIYLSFSKTNAGYVNVKVGIFEAIACKSCVVTEMFDEMELYFSYGVDILGYVNREILVDLIETYLTNERLREWIANNSYRRLLEEHTWIKRWEEVLKDIEKCKLE